MGDHYLGVEDSLAEALAGEAEQGIDLVDLVMK